MSVPTGACVVIPGESITDGQTYADADMRLIAKPTVYVGNGEIGSAQMDPTLLASLGGGSSGGTGGGAGSNDNYFLNPNFGDPFWERGTGPLSCPAGAATILADDWWVNPGGAAVTQQQSTSVPNVGSLFTLLIQGAASVTAVLAGQNLPRDVSAFLQQPFTVSFAIYNGTGAAFVPAVQFATAAGVNNFGSVNVQNTTAASSCAASTWTRVSVTIDGSTFAGMDNGLQVAVQIPSGSLAGTTQSVNLSQMKLEIGGAATAFVPPYDLLETLPQGNLFVNGNLDETLWGVSSGSCPPATDTVLVDRWFCNPAVAACTLSRGTAVPNAGSMSNATIVGGGTTDVVDFGQNFERALSGQLAQDLTFTGWLYNGTGTSIAPSLMIWTPAGANQFGGTLNLQNQAALATCNNGAWTQLQATISGNVTGIGNGLRIAVRLPSGAVAGGKSVYLAQMQLVIGDVATPFQVARTNPPAPAIIGQTRGLIITNDSANPGTKIDITCGSAVLENAGGFAILGTGVSATVNAGTTGANGLDTGSLAASTHYAVWLIGTGPQQAVAGLLSLSYSAPALPAGYTYAALAGSVCTDSTTNFLFFRQYQRSVWMRPNNVLNAVAPAANTWEAVSLSSCVPPVAQVVTGNYGTQGGTRIRIAGDANGLGCVLINLADTSGEMTGPAPASDMIAACAQFRVCLATAQTLYYSTPNGAATEIIEITGYEL